MCELAASAIAPAGSVRPDQVLVMSTGVIVISFTNGKSATRHQSAAKELAATENGFLNAADGILTTDNGRKVTSRSMTVAGRDSYCGHGQRRGHDWAQHGYHVVLRIDRCSAGS